MRTPMQCSLYVCVCVLCVVCVVCTAVDGCLYEECGTPRCFTIYATYVVVLPSTAMSDASLI